jgi:outer membrane receptor for ferrienterochelin and colicins
MKHLLILFLTLTYHNTFAQDRVVNGSIENELGISIADATIKVLKLNNQAKTDSIGFFNLSKLPKGTLQLRISASGYVTRLVTVIDGNEHQPHLILTTDKNELEEVVVTGTMKEVSKLDSPVPVEIYTSKFFRANPTPSIFESLQNINGVRPQLNCNICSTGDIHINGLEGPYTMILIDGMPIVSGLSTVYGLSGIPQSIIDRVEIVKGPASSLYGSEAVGGLINIITKKPEDAALISADVFGTSWGEINTDLSARLQIGEKAQSLLGINHFIYQNPIDDNKDGFTDVTQQHRISIFNKWSFKRRDNRQLSVAARYVYEDRWGGEMNWNKSYRGGREVYGESIYTSRWELFGNYQLPVKEEMFFTFSANSHDQNSVYGDLNYQAKQNIGFAQLTWNRSIKRHDLLAGLAYRYTFYDDNTPATSSFGSNATNMPSKISLPGIFLQDEIKLDTNNTLLLGARYDYNSIHGNILTPRINYKWNSDDKHNVLRLSLGSGFRVANVFTEDHAALTGARDVVFISDLKPETSWNGNINFVKRMYTGNGGVFGLDATAFYTYFTNKIIADYLTDPNKIIYNNLEGYAVSKGISLNADLSLRNGFSFLLGGTLMDVYSKQETIEVKQLFTEHFAGVWNIGYKWEKANLKFDYTGNIYSPMRLPLLSATDPRKAVSPWWSIQNIQITKSVNKGLDFYGGVKNLLNWTPNKGNPFLIARANDPFDKQVQFDAAGMAMVTADNPYGLTFDPTYVYAPNQGIRYFFGIRYKLQ